MKSEENELHGFEPRVLVETVEAAAVEAEDILAALAGVTKRLLAEAQGSSSSSSSSPLSLVEEAPRALDSSRRELCWAVREFKLILRGGNS